MGDKSLVILMKLIMTFVSASIAFVLLGNSLLLILPVAIIVAALNFYFGDILILPAYGNVAASIADGLIAALAAFVVGQVTGVFQTNIITLTIFALLAAVSEYVFHQYLFRTRKVAP